MAKGQESIDFHQLDLRKFDLSTFHTRRHSPKSVALEYVYMVAKCLYGDGLLTIVWLTQTMAESSLSFFQIPTKS